MSRIFGTDGVRGIANTELTADLAYSLGRAGAYVLTEGTHKPKILVAKDTRISGDMLEAALVAGILSVGAEAVMIGVVPTPAVAYLTREYNADAGVMISASHNPVEYNGIKFFDNRGYKLSDELEDKIQKTIEDGFVGVPSHIGKDLGKCHFEAEGINKYMEHAKSTIATELTGLKVALDCEAFGAEGITVHPRPDERHIRRSDVYALRPLLTTEFNIEGYPSPEFIDLVLKVKPHQVTLVPDAPDQITSNAGWDTKANLSFLTELMDTFGHAGIRTSIFVNTEREMIEYAAKAGADRVELYTEPYATLYPRNPEAAVAPFVEAAKVTRSLGMGLNAGHDLSLVNLKYMHDNIPWLDEVSIGHALISDALYLGLKQTIEEYKNCLR